MDDDSTDQSTLDTATGNSSGGFFSGLTGLVTATMPLFTNQPAKPAATPAATSGSTLSSLLPMILIGGAVILGLVLFMRGK